ncbi:MAG: energy-coupling factor transporter ATPase [Eubacterium sp.]|nr:energy-coupling factor transporter ATPase [Eubacterium sp.]
MNLIEFKNVDFSYTIEEIDPNYEPSTVGKLLDTEDDKINKKLKVLENLNLTIEKGSFVALLGHNGSGKSTIAKLTNGILFAENGEVIVDGQLIKDDDSIFDIRKKVGMVFQNPDNQIVSSIVEEDVAFGVENLGIPPEECRKRVDEALKTVGMYDYRLKSPSKLSGGQKQRVAVAGIIAMKPECIVLDEPTAMLDPSGRREVIETVKKLNREEGITIVLITHYMDEAVQADRVIVIDNGRIKLDGTPESVFANVDMLKSLGLDVPQSTELVYRLGLESEHTILNADDCAEFIKSKLEVQ